MLRVEPLVLDAHSPVELATFWEGVLGWQKYVEGDDAVILHAPDTDVASVVRSVLFLRVPDAKTTKNRLHLDLRPDDQTAEVARLESLGARRVDIGQGEVTWVVLADPEGNEFCVLAAEPADG